MSENAQIRVMVVDQIAESRKAICSLLLPLPDIEVVGVARDGHEGVRLAQALEPQAILWDPSFSDMESLQTIRALSAQRPAAHIIVVTASSDTEYLRQAMMAGARTFLAQPPKAADLADAIRRSIN